MNPYWGANFFEFFGHLFSRLFSWSGGIQTDEVQIGVLALSAISCGLVGPFLVLKRMAMFANSLSHTILIGMVGAYLLASSLWGGNWFDLSTLLIGALAAALITAFLTEGLVRLFRLQEDASVGLVFTALFALGILMASVFTRDLHLGVEAVMGNADALLPSDFWLVLQLLGINAAVILVFYRSFRLMCFDMGFARSIGMKCGLCHFLLLFLAALTCVGAFRAIGVLLVLAFLVGPYLTARLFCRTLPQILFWSPVIGVAASLIGVALARHLLSQFGWALSTGGIVVCLIGIIYLVGVQINRFTLRRRIC